MWNESHVSNILQSSVSPSTPPDLQRDGRPYEIASIRNDFLYRSCEVGCIIGQIIAGDFTRVGPIDEQKYKIWNVFLLQYAIAFTF